MINMKISSRDLKPLIEEVVKRSDSNRDGKVSRSEFETFLTGLLTKLPNAASSLATKAEAAGSAKPPVRP